MSTPHRAVLLMVVCMLAFVAGKTTATCDSALLVIDVQKLWVEEEGWLTVDGAHIVDAVATVLESVREAGLLVVFIKDVSTSYATEDQLEFADAAAPRGGELVIEKLERSAFDGTQLRQILEARGIKRLLISGITSYACVSATINEARELGYETIVIADAHSGGSNGKIAGFRNRWWIRWGISVLLTEEIDFASLCANP
jgi:nicotinamidase-related amidase